MHDPRTITDQVREQIRLGRRDAARTLLDAALTAAPDQPELRYLRGMLHAEAGADRQALADFDAALRLAPDVPPLRFNRGLVLFRLEFLPEALADFEHLVRIQPGHADAWTNIGIIQLRQGRIGEAITSLETAHRLAPASPVVMRTLGNALRDAGRPHDALLLHQRVLQATPADPAALTDCALCLLSLDRHETARDLYRRALALDPGDQTALAGLVLAGESPAAGGVGATLMDYESLLDCSVPRGADALDLQTLREQALAHERLVWEPAGRSTRAGRQSSLLDLAPGSRFSGYHERIVRHVQQRMRDLASDPRLAGHPWLAAMPRRWHLQSWITVLEQGGQQTPHIHPAGWLSGVVYVDAGRPLTADAGNLVFGHAPADIPLRRPVQDRTHHPVAGQIVTFPSYFFHHTTPYQGAGPRISMAFDVVPDP